MRPRPAPGAEFRSLNRRNSPSWGDCSFRLISPPMRFPPQAVIGGSPLDPHSANRRTAFNGFVSARSLEGTKSLWASGPRKARTPGQKHDAVKWFAQHRESTRCYPTSYFRKTESRGRRPLAQGTGAAEAPVLRSIYSSSPARDSSSLPT